MGIFMCFPPLYSVPHKKGGFIYIYSLCIYIYSFIHIYSFYVCIYLYIITENSFCFACFLSWWDRRCQSLTWQMIKAGTPTGVQLSGRMLTWHMRGPGTQCNRIQGLERPQMPCLWDVNGRDFCILFFFPFKQKPSTSARGLHRTIISSFWGTPVSSEWSLPSSAQVSMTAAAQSTFCRATLGTTSCKTFSRRDLSEEDASQFRDTKAKVPPRTSDPGL